MRFIYALLLFFIIKTYCIYLFSKSTRSEPQRAFILAPKLPLQTRHFLVVRMQIVPKLALCPGTTLQGNSSTPINVQVVFQYPNTKFSNKTKSSMHNASPAPWKTRGLQVRIKKNTSSTLQRILLLPLFQTYATDFATQLKLTLKFFTF